MQAMNIMLIYVLIAYPAVVTTQNLHGSVSLVLLAAGAGLWALRAIIQPILFGMRNRVWNALIVPCKFYHGAGALGGGRGLWNRSIPYL